MYKKRRKLKVYDEDGVLEDLICFDDPDELIARFKKKYG